MALVVRTLPLNVRGCDMNSSILTPDFVRNLHQRVERQRQVLGELNDLVAAVEAVSELVSPTGALSPELCLELLETHFLLTAKNLLNDAMGGLKPA